MAKGRSKAVPIGVQDTLGVLRKVAHLEACVRLGRGPLDTP